MKKAIILLFLLFVIPTFGTVSDGSTVRQSFTPISTDAGLTYTFTFECNSSDDVFVYAPLTSTGDPVDALAVSVDYSIVPTGGDYLNGGVVTIIGALSDEYTVKIVRRIKQSQETSQGAITPTSIVASLDKLTRQVQDAEDRKDRSIHAPESDPLTILMTLPNSIDRAGKFLFFDSLGNATAGSLSESGGIVHSVIGTAIAGASSELVVRQLIGLDTTDPVEFAAITGTTGTFSGLIAANAGLTLGDNQDLIGSTTSAINMNAFDVDENGVGTIGTSFDIGGTIAVVGTLDDDTMATATDTTVSTSESVKAYVDSIRVVNIEQATKSDTQTITASTNVFTPITGLTVSINPSSESSKVLVYAMITGTAGGSDPLKLQLFRDSTEILQGIPSGNRIGVTTNIWEGSSGRGHQNAVIMFLDSPSSVASVTYSVKASSISTAYIGRSTGDADDTFHNRSTCNIIVQEILQ